MAIDFNITEGDARRLLAILELEQVEDEEDINWALSIIHQLPGYEDISISRAASDEILRQLIVALASGEIAPTTLREAEYWMNQAKEAKRQRELAKEKGEKEAGEYIESTKKAARGAKMAPAAKEEIKPTEVPAPEIAQVPPSAAPSPRLPDLPRIFVPVSYAKGLKGGILKTRDRILTLPYSLALELGGKKLAEKFPEEVSASHVLVHGWTEDYIHQSALASGRTPSQITKFKQTMRDLPTPLVYRIFTGKAEWSEFAFASYLTGGKFTPAELQTFVPSPDGTSMALPTSSFGVGGFLSQIGQRVLGNVASNALEKMIGVGVEKAAEVAITKGVTTAATAAIPGIGPAIALFLNTVGSKVIGFVKNLIKSIIPQEAISKFIQKYKDYILPSILIGGGLLLGGMGLIPLAILVGGAGGVAFLGVGLGGTSAAGAKVGTFGGAFLYGLTHVVLPSIAIPVAISMVVLVTIFSLIYFIITTGAFVMPGGQGGANLPRGIGPGALGKVIPAPEKGADKLCLPINGHVTQGAFCEDGDTSLSHCAGQKGENAYDIGALPGTPIYAVHGGRACAYTGGVYGNRIEIYGTYNGQEVHTLYAHMLPHDPTFFPPGTCKFDASGNLVDGYTEVTAGSIIGRVGNSGLSTGAHLHFGLVSDTVHIASVFGKVVQNQIVQNCFSK